MTRHEDLQTAGRSVIIDFPIQPRPQPAEFGASWWDIVRSEMRAAIGQAANNFGLPGAIAPMNFCDPVTGQQINVSISPRFVRLNINGRDYYFHRLTGRFDGTGMGCC